MQLAVLLVMKILKDEQYIVIKAYKFTIFENLRDLLHYHIIIACSCYPFI